jgi:hypothetical protein
MGVVGTQPFHKKTTTGQTARAAQHITGAAATAATLRNTTLTAATARVNFRSTGAAVQATSQRTTIPAATVRAITASTVAAGLLAWPNSIESEQTARANRPTMDVARRAAEFQSMTITAATARVRALSTAAAQGPNLPRTRTRDQTALAVTPLLDAVMARKLRRSIWRAPTVRAGRACLAAATFQKSGSSITWDRTVRASTLSSVAVQVRLQAP